MKHLLTALILLVSQVSGLAQTRPSRLEKAFINQAVAEWHRIPAKKRINYIDHLYSFTVSSLLNDVKDTIYHKLGNLDRLASSDTLVLSAEELKYAKRTIKEMDEKIWDRKLFGRWEELDADELLKMTRSRWGWEKYYKKYSTGYYSFSKPIFLRDNSICIFYIGYSCGEFCHEADLSVYKTENGKWKKWIVLHSSSS